MKWQTSGPSRLLTAVSGTYRSVCVHLMQVSPSTCAAVTVKEVGSNGGMADISTTAPCVHAGVRQTGLPAKWPIGYAATSVSALLGGDS